MPDDFKKMCDFFGIDASGACFIFGADKSDVENWMLDSLAYPTQNHNWEKENTLCLVQTNWTKYVLSRLPIAKVLKKKLPGMEKTLIEMFRDCKTEKEIRKVFKYLFDELVVMDDRETMKKINSLVYSYSPCRGSEND